MDEKRKDEIVSYLKGIESSQVATLVLDIHNDPSVPAQKEPLDSAQFKTRDALRKALVERQVAQTADVIQTSQSALARHGLKTQAGEITGTVTVQGTAEQLKAALAEPFVKTATIDFEIGLITPSRQED